MGVQQCERHSLWRDLSRGTAQVTRSFIRDGQMLMELSIPELENAGPRGHRDLTLFRQFLENPLQKALALDENLSAATIGQILKQSLSSLGVAVAPSRTPLLLVLAARAAVHGHSIDGLLSDERRAERALLRTYALHSPEAWLRRTLSPRQTHVALLRIEGLTHAAIAERCRISIRTVANHVASIHEKLQVKGRLELIYKIASEYEAGRVPPPAAN